MYRAFSLTQTFFKMEKEKLSEQLRGLVGENSLSDRTWDDYLSNSVMPFLPSEKDKINDYLAKHANAIKSLNGQLNNEVASKVNDFKKNYKPEPPKKEDKDPEPPKGNDDKLQEIEERLLKFEKADQEKKTAKLKQELLEKVEKELKDQGASNKAILKLILPQLTIDDKTSVEDLTKQGKSMYDETYSDLYGGDNYVPAYGNSGGGRKGGKDAYMKHLQETGRLKKPT